MLYVFVELPLNRPPLVDVELWSVFVELPLNRPPLVDVESVFVELPLNRPPLVDVELSSVCRVTSQSASSGGC